ncbi:mitochondrial cardiolipin synthase, putative [Plasmodium yoelii]|uniref:Cardiolipin synthetase n=3 Tax=Plasmodium yoelii TaxID=5861 RepID=Q7R9G1_PLAYO|nr:mitochondrial cardiolipin synthase, putative [Plasmodium yoelii]EAA19221.1 cardiolipin synthetase [Plasmodium yoelii yoelii]WBY54524.1 mitochondrial cardiolipin synthase [Plasmodium yoelii yoelii]CDU15925.1 mitochondrial cardiolipin synthase, putative [Plasmodium yoelii]VTZ71520.1 mitochondrial cardiolipin synthase, putative [Plasmodium yoelii]|eukprot:XP_727656.1 mitochondrial cardiolipin synthase, putative [Plasmodium yoelii]
MKVENKLREKIYKHILNKKGEEWKEDGIDFTKLVDSNVEKLNLNENDKILIKRKWVNILKRNAEKYGKVSEGNKIKIYNTGYACFKNIIKSIDRCKKRVWFESYIFDDSNFAEQIINSLCNASKRGCDVILLVDYIGSLKLKNKWVNKLKENNVNVIFFNTFLNSFLNILPIFFRDHRKIIILDDSAYCGSMNVSENVIPNFLNIVKNDKNERLLNIEKGCQNYNLLNKKESDNIEEDIFINDMLGKKNNCLEYYDLHVKLKGPAVKDLADVFLDSLKMSNANIIREPIENQKKYKKSDGDNSGCYIQVLESNVLRKIKSIQSSFEYIIKNGATNNIYITTSYFLPPGFLRRALFYALSNGVNISFLFSGNSDILGDVPATYYIIKKFLRKYGHAKDKMVCDNISNNDDDDDKILNFENRLINNYHNVLYSKKDKLLKWKKIYFKDLKKHVEYKFGDNLLLRKKHKGISEFYFFEKKHCHAKNIVIDNLWCSIGSFNWDRFSSRRNLEVMISIFDKNISDQFIKEHEEKKKNSSKQITLSNINNRNVFQIFFSYCAYHIGKLYGKNIFDGLSNNNKKTILRKAIINRYLADNCIDHISLNMMWGT